MPSKYGVETLQEERAKAQAIAALKVQEKAAEDARVARASEEEKRRSQEKARIAKETLSQKAWLVQDVINDVTRARDVSKSDIHVHAGDGGGIFVEYNSQKGSEVERVANTIAEILTNQGIDEVHTFDTDPKRWEMERMAEYRRKIQDEGY